MSDQIHRRAAVEIQALFATAARSLLSDLEAAVNAACDEKIDHGEPDAEGWALHRAERMKRAVAMVRGGKSQVDAAKACGVDRSDLCKACKAAGVKSKFAERAASSAKHSAKPAKNGQSREDRMLRAVELVRSGKSQMWAAKKCRVPQTTLSGACKRAGVTSKFPPVRAKAVKRPSNPANVARAVAMVRDEGKSQIQAAKACGVSKSTVRRECARLGVKSVHVFAKAPAAE